MNRQQFVDTFGSLFQGPDWVVERAFDRLPFADTADLRAAFQEALFAASEEEQRQLIASYPNLGAPSVAAGDEGAGSLRDQSSLALTRLAEDEQNELEQLTAAYRERFGFPLVTSIRREASFDDVLRSDTAGSGSATFPPRNTPPLSLRSPTSPDTGSMTWSPTPIRSMRRAPVAWKTSCSRDYSAKRKNASKTIVQLTSIVLRFFEPKAGAGVTDAIYRAELHEILQQPDRTDLCGSFCY